MYFHESRLIVEQLPGMSHCVVDIDRYLWDVLDNYVIPKNIVDMTGIELTQVAAILFKYIELLLLKECIILKCPACNSVIGIDGDNGLTTNSKCDICTAKRRLVPQTAYLVDTTKRTLPVANDTTADKTIILLHGILSVAPWHKTYHEVANDNKWNVRDEKWYYGIFRVLDLLSFSQREGKVKWLRDVYSEESKDVTSKFTVTNPPCAIAHSFGTYILGYAMLRYDYLRFDKIILCGSILPRDFPWDKIIRRGQVNTIKNEYGARDIPSRLVGYIVPGTGGSGEKGFCDMHPLLVQEEFNFEHSEYFSQLHMREKWNRFLASPVQQMGSLQTGAIHYSSNRFPIGLFLIWPFAIIISMLVWPIRRIFKF